MSKRVGVAMRTTALGQLGVLLALAGLVACSGGKGGSQNDAKTLPTAIAAYGITAHVVVNGHPERSGWQHVAPVDWQSWKTATEVQTHFTPPPAKALAAKPRSPSL